ncbi:MAG: hypothetical protein HKN40_12640 [Winogradskyella sp.]|uniref:hypothetical protein n=1 Tax=Winogradskyella sp. TaxID=1883156 RepID=UPI0018378429|nr:hypothetical protein [Winogradskyella sp.]
MKKLLLLLAFISLTSFNKGVVELICHSDNHTIVKVNGIYKYNGKIVSYNVAMQKKALCLQENQ